MDGRLGWRINEFILVGIIVFQFLDFFKLLDPFWDYVKKIVSWALIAYLLYLTSPSAMFFGKKEKWWDAAVIISLFMMTLKNIVSFAAAARDTMTEHVLKYVSFVHSPDTIPGVANITLSEASYNTFNLLGTYLANASMYAKPFASQLTISNPSIPFTLLSGEQSMTALLQPYGMNGLIFQLYNTLANHAAVIERVSFIIGTVLVLGLGIYAALRFHVEERSVLAVIHEHGELQDVMHALKRVLAVLLVLTAFFLLLFNLVVEWLAIAIDAPLAMIGLAVYLLIAVQFHRKMHRNLRGEDLLTKIGGFGTDFLKDFARLFTSRRTVLLGLSGLLVLHLLVDIGTFLIPYATGLRDPLYFGHLGAGHDTLFMIISANWTGLLATDLSVLGLYVLNTVGLFMLLALPAYIWYKVFKLRTREDHEAEHDHHPILPGWLIALSFSGIAAFLATPAFTITKITSEALIGVDVQTHSITTGHPGLWLFAFLVLFLVLLFASFSKHAKNLLMAALFGTSILFFGVYTYHFFMATITYYLREGISLFGAGSWSLIYLACILLLFLLINLLFYVFGFLSFIYETVWGD